MNSTVETWLRPVCGVLNFSGVGLNVALMGFIYLKIKHPLWFHILTLNLALACITASFTFGVECIIGNLTTSSACQTYTLFYASSILTQVYSVMAIAIGHFVQVQFLIRIHNRTAYFICALVWIVPAIVTSSVSIFSAMYSMGGGVYCFFQFDSIVMVSWIAPSLLISFLVALACYIRVFYVSWMLSKETASSAQSFDRSKEMAGRMASRFVSLLAILFICWSPLGIASLYEWWVAPATLSLQISVAIFGSFHSVLVPTVYGYYIHEGNLRELRIRLVVPYSPRREAMTSSSSPRMPKKLYTPETGVHDWHRHNPNNNLLSPTSIVN
jgi:hypothetical protein